VVRCLRVRMGVLRRGVSESEYSPDELRRVRDFARDDMQ